MPMIFVTVDNMFAFEVEELGDEDSMIAYAKELTLEAIAGLSDDEFQLIVEVEDDQ